MYIGLFIGSPFIAKIYNEDVLVPVIRVMGIILFINAFNAVASARVSSQLAFKRYFFATLGGTLISAFVGIVMALKGFGCWALVAQQMCNTTIDTLILMITSKFKVVFKVSFKKLKSLFNFGWKIFVSNIISTLYDEINPLIIGLKYSNADLAFYAKGRSFPNILNTTVGDTFSSVFFPVASKLQDNPKQMLNATRRFMRISTFVIFPSMIGFLSVANNFVIVLLTEKWLPATIYIQIFSVVFMFNVIQKGNLQVIQACGRSDLILIMEIIKKSIYFVVIGLFLFLSNKPEWLAIACLINTLIATVINTFPNRKIIGYSYKLQILDILPNLVTSVIMGAIVLMIGKIPMNSFCSLLLQVVSGAIVYILLNLVIKNENLSYFIRTIKETLFTRSKTSE